MAYRPKIRNSSSPTVASAHQTLGQANFRAEPKSLSVERGRQLGHSIEQAVPTKSGESDKPIQRWPFQARHKENPVSLVVKMEGNQIALYRHGVHVGYLEIQLRQTDNGTIYELKDIIIDDSLQGNGVGYLLIYFFALVAESANAISLVVLLNNGQNLYQNAGFTVHSRFDIRSDVATVKNTAGGLARARFNIGPYQPPQPAAKPAPHRDPRRHEDDLFPL